MSISAFDLFSIGIGPSSSHTVGPMRAAKFFLNELEKQNLLIKTTRIQIDLYGSLALTGKGHGTDIAILLGLTGQTPEGIDPDSVPVQMQKIRSDKVLPLFSAHPISFEEGNDLLFHKTHQLPYHPNAVRFTAYAGTRSLEKVYYSVGGGFVVPHEATLTEGAPTIESHSIPFPFNTAAELLAQCGDRTIAELMMENEKSWRSEEEVRKGIVHIWHVMEACIARGCKQEGELPGGLHVRRRAKKLYEQLQQELTSPRAEHLFEWLSVWALAVNEENAAGARVVTAPTNGAAGVIPSVLKYYQTFVPGASDTGIVTFLLTAAAMGILFKKGASISAAQMGCMGEVGVACSMAAAGLAAVMGGTNAQITNAAEIGMEHHLGLTCDPVMGLVQIPCIERNTMGAVKAVNAALLSLRGDGVQRVSLDQVIATMLATGNDMQSIYKETSLGGLAVNVPEC